MPNNMTPKRRSKPELHAGRGASRYDLDDAMHTHRRINSAWVGLCNALEQRNKAPIDETLQNLADAAAEMVLAAIDLCGETGKVPVISAAERQQVIGALHIIATQPGSGISSGSNPANRSETDGGQ